MYISLIHRPEGASLPRVIRNKVKTLVRRERGQGNGMERGGEEGRKSEAVCLIMRANISRLRGQG